MKILQLIYESFGNPFGFGGAGVRAYEIYRRLKDRHDITLLCMKYPGARDGEIEGLRHIFVGTESRSLARSVIAYTLKASSYIKHYGNDFDIVVENFLPSTPFFSRFLTKTPVVLQIQGIMGRHSLKKFNPIYAFPMYGVEKFYPYLYDRFIFVSEVTMDKVMSGFNGRKQVKSCLIPNGISRDYLNYNCPEDDYILFLSRIDIYTKGLDILVMAFERISMEFPDLRLVMTGYEFDRFNKVLALCDAGISCKIEYAGFLTGIDKIKLLSRAKVFVLPSRHESSPISILEAAACGRSVIVSDIPELAFVTENNFGLSFKSGSSDDLADKMRLLLNDEWMRKEMGHNGRIFSSQYLWDDIALRFESVLEDICNEKKGSHR